MKKKKRTKAVFKSDSSANGSNVGMSVALGTICAAAVWLIMLAVFSACAAKAGEPNKYITPMAFSASSLGALAGGFSAGRIRRSSGLLTGLVAGACFAAVLFAASLAFKTDVGFAFRTALLLCVIAFGAVGGKIGASPKKRARRGSRA